MQSRIVKGDQIQDEFWPSQGNIFGPADARHQADQNEHHLPHLAAEGLRPDAAEELTNTFRRIRLLADYYYNYCDWADTVTGPKSVSMKRARFLCFLFCFRWDGLSRSSKLNFQLLEAK